MKRLHELVISANKDGLNKYLDSLHNTSELNEVDQRGDTALHYACSLGLYECAKLLLKKGASHNVPDGLGLTPLHFCAKTPQAKIADILLKKGASVKSTDFLGHTPLHYAAMYGQVDVAKLLIEKGAPIDFTSVRKYAPLHFAALAGHKECVLLLIEKGAKLHMKNDVGNCPLTLLPFPEKDQVEAPASGGDISLEGLSSNLLSMLNSPFLSDVSFDVEGQKIYAHKVILACRSPSFHEMFSREKDDRDGAQSIKMDDVRSEVFLAFLEFLYSGTVQRFFKGDAERDTMDANFILEMLMIAKVYKIEQLSDLIETIVSRYFHKNNFVSFLRECQSVGGAVFSKRLKQICARFLAKNYNSLAASASDSDLKTETVVEILREAQIETISTFSNTYTYPFQRKKVDPQKTNDVSHHPLQGRILNEAKSLLKNLQSDRNAEAFNEPVDPLVLGIPDYFYVVPQPMDLGTIKKRLESNYYDTMENFANDIRLTFKNAIKFNQPGSEICRTAEKFLKMFDQKYRTLISQLSDKPGAPSSSSLKPDDFSYSSPVGSPSNPPPKSPTKKSREKEKESVSSNPPSVPKKRRLDSLSNGDQAKAPPTKERKTSEKSEKKSKTEKAEKDSGEKSGRDGERGEKTSSTSSKAERKGTEKAPEPKSKEVKSKKLPPMTFDQKKELGNKINNLSTEQLGKVIEIMESSNKINNSGEAEDIEIDMNDLDDDTLWELHSYLLSCLPNDTSLTAFKAGFDDDEDDKKEKKEKKKKEKSEKKSKSK